MYHVCYSMHEGHPVYVNATHPSHQLWEGMEGARSHMEDNSPVIPGCLHSVMILMKIQMKGRWMQGDGDGN